MEISAILLGTLFIAGGMLGPSNICDGRVRVILVSLYLATASLSLAGFLSWGCIRRVDGPVTEALRSLAYAFFSLGWLATFLASGTFVLKFTAEEISIYSFLIAVGLGLFFVVMVLGVLLVVLFRVKIMKKWKRSRPSSHFHCCVLQHSDLMGSSWLEAG